MLRCLADATEARLAALSVRGVCSCIRLHAPFDAEETLVTILSTDLSTEWALVNLFVIVQVKEFV